MCSWALFSCASTQNITLLRKLSLLLNTHAELPRLRISVRSPLIQGAIDVPSFKKLGSKLRGAIKSTSSRRQFHIKAPSSGSKLRSFPMERERHIETALSRWISPRKRQSPAIGTDLSMFDARGSSWNGRGTVNHLPCVGSETDHEVLSVGVQQESAWGIHYEIHWLCRLIVLCSCLPHH